VPAAGGESRAVSAIPNANTNVLSWSPDGTFLVFNTSQRTEDTSIVRVDLTLRAPKFGEDQFRDLFRDEPGRTGRAGGAGEAMRRPRAREAGSEAHRHRLHGHSPARQCAERRHELQLRGDQSRMAAGCS
jgi:hypothetical protein